MNMNRLRKRFMHWFLGEYIVELQAIDMMPEVKSAVREYLQILRDILSEIKLLRVTQG